MDSFVFVDTSLRKWVGGVHTSLWRTRNTKDGQVKVHNAFMIFRQGNHFPDFYTDTAKRLLDLKQGTMPAQFIGPKLLTSLHNIALFPVMETAGMLSPAVILDLLAGEDQALDLFN